MKAYIAAPYPVRDQAIRIMRVLELRGIEVTSRWLKAPDEMTDAYAQQDLEDVAVADVLIAVNAAGWEEKGTGGRHVELGYALALGKPIVLMGERTNIFHHLTSVTQIDESGDFIKAVQKLGVSTCEIFTPQRAIALVVSEFLRAERKHKPMNSPHEGYAVIQEEVDELWADVKADRGREPCALHEATQIAAMGLRYLYDIAQQQTPKALQESA